MMTVRPGVARASAQKPIPVLVMGGARCLSTALQGKVNAFREDVRKHLPENPEEAKKVVFATAWLATDNVFVALMHEHFPEKLKAMNLVAIDTLHLFPETLECAKLVEERYAKPALWYYPQGVKTLDGF